MQETYQELQKLLPIERQMLLAEIYHYMWYNPEAYQQILLFIDQWEKQSEIKAVFFKSESEDSTNQL